MLIFAILFVVYVNYFFHLLLSWFIEIVYYFIRILDRKVRMIFISRLGFVFLSWLVWEGRVVVFGFWAVGFWDWLGRGLREKWEMMLLGVLLWRFTIRMGMWIWESAVKILRWKNLKMRSVFCKKKWRFSDQLLGITRPQFYLLWLYCLEFHGNFLYLLSLFSYFLT